MAAGRRTRRIRHPADERDPSRLCDAAPSAATDASRACGGTSQSRAGYSGATAACTVARAGERAAPCGDLRQAGEDAEIADAVEGIEIAEHRPEHRVDEAEAFAVEPWTFQARFDAREFVPQRCRLGVERRLIGRRVEARDVVEDRRAELDPGAMLGAGERIGRVQRLRLASPRDIRGSRRTRRSAPSASTASGTAGTGVLPSGETRRNQSGLFGEIDVAAFERHALFRSARSRRAAHRGRACG